MLVSTRWHGITDLTLIQNFLPRNFLARHSAPKEQRFWPIRRRLGSFRLRLSYGEIKWRDKLNHANLHE